MTTSIPIVSVRDYYLNDGQTDWAKDPEREYPLAVWVPWKTNDAASYLTTCYEDPGQYNSGTKDP